jgi:hypothetical protein
VETSIHIEQLSAVGFTRDSWLLSLEDLVSSARDNQRFQKGWSQDDLMLRLPLGVCIALNLAFMVGVALIEKGHRQRLSQCLLLMLLFQGLTSFVPVAEAAALDSPALRRVEREAGLDSATDGSVSVHTGRSLQSSACCLDTCLYASDGNCDDGGRGSDYSGCAIGADCADCGDRCLPLPPLPPLPPPLPPAPPAPLAPPAPQLPLPPWPLSLLLPSPPPPPSNSTANAFVASTRVLHRRLADIQPGRDTLQIALNAAEATLVLADGVYYGSSSFSINRDVTIRASNRGQAILDGQNARRVLTISSGTVRLEGLVIRNGLAAVSPLPRLTAHRPLLRGALSQRLWFLTGDC